MSTGTATKVQWSATNLWGVSKLTVHFKSKRSEGIIVYEKYNKQTLQNKDNSSDRKSDSALSFI